MTVSRKLFEPVKALSFRIRAVVNDADKNIRIDDSSYAFSIITNGPLRPENIAIENNVMHNFSGRDAGA